MEKPCSSTQSENVMTFDQLPDVVLGKIMSFLHWKEKQLLAIAFDRIGALIESPTAWEYFENNRNYAFHHLFKFMQFSHLLEQEIEVICLYGKYFQRCKLWLYSMDLPQLDSTALCDMGLAILNAVSVHCKHLKWLCIVHPADMTFDHLHNCNDYIKSLENIVFGSKRKCSLSLRNLFYSSMDLSMSVIDSYLYFLGGVRLLQNITCLDISHGLISNGTCKPKPIFKQCPNVSLLKCPLHSVNTNIVLDLCKQKLLRLYLVSDEHTKDQGFSEDSLLDWAKINTEMDLNRRNRFEVHYIFENRILESIDFVPNPFTKSLVLNNLTCSISACMLHFMADTYGSTIENLAFCSNYWEFLMYFTDLHDIGDSFAYVGRKCRVLRSFISCLKLPSSAILNLVRSSRTLMHVRVYKEKVNLSTEDKPVEKFQEKISHNLSEKTSIWRMVNQGENIFDIPTTNAILFDTCFREF